MSRDSLGWNLPPGVTDRMIDEQFPDTPVVLWECENCKHEEWDEEGLVPEVCPRCGHDEIYVHPDDDDD